MGVSTNTLGRSVENENSQKTLDQSVIRTSDVKTVSLDEKSRSKKRSDSGTCA